VVTTTNSLVGNAPGDRIGLGGITPLANGNYVVDSYDWSNGAAASAGAVTWCSGVLGCTGVVSSTNSLVGGATSDQVGTPRTLFSDEFDPGLVVTLTNSSYVVLSPLWHSGTGAATWGSGTTAITGVVSSANSLVGDTTGDLAGFGAQALTNGNYVVTSDNWSNGATASAGAVTWGSGTHGITGTISVGNSLVGSQFHDFVGDGITPLANGNYVVDSFSWHNGSAAAGAATWGDGTHSITGVVGISNSLVGSSDLDNTGIFVAALTNGNYVVASPAWSHDGLEHVGAATWGDGTHGITGPVTLTNSLVGSQAGDLVADTRVTALTNGNYVVSSAFWNNGVITETGAATWGNGATGITGVVTLTNSLVGGATGDQIGLNGITALPDGDYVVASNSWHNGPAARAGATTWGDGTHGITGLVAAANSLVGTHAHDAASGQFVTVLANGNYVVVSPSWANGPAASAGAATWCSGAVGCQGPVSASNSLVGSRPSDLVGEFFATPLANGNYVVNSPYWANGPMPQAGAVTWGNGASGTTGPVTTTNSLFGATAGDQVGSYSITPLTNGDYLVSSAVWHNGPLANAGAVTLCASAAGCTGAVGPANSVVGGVANGSLFALAYDYVNHQPVVGRPSENVVTLQALPTLLYLYLPVMRRGP
jgi:hypothetical protein